MSASVRHAIRSNDPRFVVNPWDNPKLVQLVLDGVMPVQDLGPVPSRDHPALDRLKRAGKLEGIRVPVVPARYDSTKFVSGSGCCSRPGYDKTDMQYQGN